jgi:NitT/TauT family transport system substrate-binding protein
MSVRRFALLIAILLLGAGCSPRGETVTVRIGLLPVLDTLPIYVAKSQGFFEARGIAVEIVPVASAPERDQLMQSGQIDAMVNEIVSVLFFNQSEMEVTAVRFARTATAEYPLFRILASKDSTIETPNDLRGVPIGVSQGTVIEYTTERLLQNAGLSPEEIETLAVPKIPDRLNLLETGQLAAANLPDPAASLAILGGARPILDDTSLPEISHSIISFQSEFLQAHPQIVRGFLAAVEEAVQAINADKTQWDTLMIEHNLMPVPLIDTYTLPDFPLAAVPSQSQFMDALEWAQGKGLVSGSIPYEGSVDASYLP